MIPRAIIELAFSAASIQRWNEYVRPVALTELDKQAHKAMIAFTLARYEEDNGRPVDWLALIEGFIFEFLPRVVLTDIKAPVFYELMRRNGPAISRHVLQVLEPQMQSLPGGLFGRFRDYLGALPPPSLERQILQAAHYLSTQWEFRLVHHASPFLHGIEQTRIEIEQRQEQFMALRGVQETRPGRPASGFVDLCGQLRFQQRWAQTPRLPPTTVLGHSGLVALLAYLLSLEMDFCPRRRRNAFCTALFHDLPEVFTRDIISPVKRSIEGLDALIAAEEKRLVEAHLLPLLPPTWHAEMLYFVENPFANRVRIDGRVREVTLHELDGACNRDACEPVDGEFIKGCDDLAAYLEATASIRHGISSAQLREGCAALAGKYRDRTHGPIHWNDYFATFAV